MRRSFLANVDPKEINFDKVKHNLDRRINQINSYKGKSYTAPTTKGGSNNRNNSSDRLRSDQNFDRDRYRESKNQFVKPEEINLSANVANNVKNVGSDNFINKPVTNPLNSSAEGNTGYNSNINSRINSLEAGIGKILTRLNSQPDNSHNYCRIQSAYDNHPTQSSFVNPQRLPDYVNPDYPKSEYVNGSITGDNYVNPPVNYSAYPHFAYVNSGHIEKEHPQTTTHYVQARHSQFVNENLVSPEFERGQINYYYQQPLPVHMQPQSSYNQTQQFGYAPSGVNVASQANHIYPQPINSNPMHSNIGKSHAQSCCCQPNCQCHQLKAMHNQQNSIGNGNDEQTIVVNVYAPGEHIIKLQGANLKKN